MNVRDEDVKHPGPQNLLSSPVHQSALAVSKSQGWELLPPPPPSPLSHPACNKYSASAAGAGAPSCSSICTCSTHSTLLQVRLSPSSHKSEKDPNGLAWSGCGKDAPGAPLHGPAPQHASQTSLTTAWACRNMLPVAQNLSYCETTTRRLPSASARG